MTIEDEQKAKFESTSRVMCYRFHQITIKGHSRLSNCLKLLSFTFFPFVCVFWGKTMGVGCGSS